MNDRILKAGKTPIRCKVWPESDYQGLDAGIRFAVRVLHAHGIETGQSCQGGEGHSYPQPTIEFAADADDATGFKALAVLQTYGLPVDSISIRWSIFRGLPHEKLWQITFWKAMEDRADDELDLIYGYQFQRTPKRDKRKTK